MASASSSTSVPVGGNACGSRNRLKLAINTHVKYAKPLQLLLASLRAVSFTRFEDVLVLVGGSDSEQPPTRAPLSRLAPGAPPEDMVVVAKTTTNGFDYHGLAMLARYRANPLIAAEVYVYVHDTVTFASDFVERYETFRLPRSPYLFTTWPLPK